MTEPESGAPAPATPPPGQGFGQGRPNAPGDSGGPDGPRGGGFRPGGGGPGGPGGRREGGGGFRGGGGGFRRGGRRRVCRICNKIRCSPGPEYKVDYKDVSRLRVFTNERGKIESRRKLASCALGQRAITQAVKRARHLALMPYTIEHVRDSRIFPLRG